MGDRLRCRSMAVICEAGVTCDDVEGHTGAHAATVAASFSAQDTWGPERMGKTTVTVTWTAPVVGPDLRTRAGRATVGALLAKDRVSRG